MSDSLYSEYIKRTGGAITPPKKMINCAASTTKLNFKEEPAVDVFRATKQPFPVGIPQVAADHIQFGASTNDKAKPSKNNANAATGADHLEFGKSETEKFTVKKIKVPTNIAHVADDKVAFGDNNINKDKAKTGKKFILEVDHIEFGASQTYAVPATAEPDHVETLFKCTHKNSEPAMTPQKPAKHMINTAHKSEMSDILTASPMNSPAKPISKTPKSVRKPVGDQESLVLGDCWSVVTEAPVRPVLVNARSEVAVPVKNISPNMISTVFDTTSEAPTSARRVKGEAPINSTHQHIRNTENVCPGNIVSVAQAMTETFALDGSRLNSPMRSAKKIIVDRGTMGSLLQDTSKEGVQRSAKKTINAGTVFAFSMPEDVKSSRSARSTQSVDPNIAAGAKVRQLEAPVRTRGPVGGQVSVVFG